MKIAVTGHRPPRGGINYDLNNQTSIQLKYKLKRVLYELGYSTEHSKIEMVYDGMALGFDTLAAEVCIEMLIPFTACVPCRNQDKMWVQKSKDHYKFLLSEASEIVLVTDAEYQGWLMDTRNRYMIDQLTNNEDVCISFHDGSKGGTYNCVEYAKKKGVKIINLYETTS